MAMNADIKKLKKVMTHFKDAQNQLQTLLKDKTWIEEARKYAERQGKEVKKLWSGDAARVRTFLERERKELEKFQKQLPGEVKKFRKFVSVQKKELEKLWKNIRRMNKMTGTAATKKSGGKKKSAKSEASANA